MFKFNFEEDDQPAKSDTSSAQPDQPTSAPRPAPKPPKVHKLESVLESLIHQRVTCTDTIPPRREVYDARHQVMLEDLDPTLLSASDLHCGVYEGGLKTWEAAEDLSKMLSGQLGASADLSISVSNQHVIELGAGAALPSCQVLLAKLEAPIGSSAGSIYVADYNYDVLRLVSAVNLLLAWVYWKGMEAVTELQIRDLRYEEGHVGPRDGEIVITPSLVAEMMSDLAARGVEIQLVEGAWGTEFCRDVGRQFDVILASETYYALDYLPDFVDTVKQLMKPTGKAFIAGKNVYFGVGGGVAELCEQLNERKLSHQLVWQTTNGVARSILQVALVG